jgi:hypothetical protein
LLPLLRVLACGGDWDAALAGALAAHEAYWEAAGKPGDPLRLTPIAIYGLAALAHDRGLTSALLPHALVRGEFTRAPVRVTFHTASGTH